jgi:hypothetical protein
MKTSLKLALLAFASLSLGACSKDPDPEQVAGGKLQLITSGVWRYYEYFYDYSEAGASLVWKVDKANVSYNLSGNQVKFNTDGSYWEIDEKGDRYDGTWTFLADSTQVKVVNSVGTFLSDIRVLDDNKLEWAATGAEEGHYGVLMHEFPGTDPVLDNATFTRYLTAHSWKYEEYFTNYTAAAANLVWKIGKPNSTLPLTKTVVKFNTDGTTTETDEAGAAYPGTWRAQNNFTEIVVSNKVGTYTSKIKVLTADRFEWNRIEQSYYYYGSMIPAE